MAVEVGRPLMAAEFCRPLMAAVPSSGADFRFNPPEDRLILEYLQPFALGRITGADSVINDDPYRVEPWLLLDKHRRDCEEGAFFFARKTMVGTRRSRTVGEIGTWRTQTSENRPVVDAASCVVAVFRKTMLSYYTAGNRTTSTGYVMYEYELFIDSDGSGGGTHDSVLCHIRKSCREVARSNKRKRQFKIQTAIAAASAAASSSGCTSRSAVLFSHEASVVIDSVDANPDSAISPSGLFESRAEDIANQLLATSLSENSHGRIPPKPACEAPVIVDDADADPNSMISLSKPPGLKASIESAGEARKIFVSKPVTGQVEITGRNSATSLSGALKLKAFPETGSEAPAVINRTNAKPDSVIRLSELPEPAALFESARKSPTIANQHSASPQSALPESRSLRESARETSAVAVYNQHSASSLSELPESRSLHESACEAPAVANANSAASQSGTKPLLESASEAPVAANPESANVQSGPPGSKAILEPPSEAAMSIVSTDLSPSKLQTISQPAFRSEDAANNFTPDASLLPLPSGASSDSAEMPSEDKPQQEELPSDSSDKSETFYSVGELIDIVETADPAATSIHHLLWELRVVTSVTIVIEELK